VAATRKGTAATPKRQPTAGDTESSPSSPTACASSRRRRGVVRTRTRS